MAKEKNPPHKIVMTEAFLLNTTSKTVNQALANLKFHRTENQHSSHRFKKKGQKDISGIDHKIILMYAKGMTTRQISDTIEDIYDFDVSEGFISDVTDKILPQGEEWQKRSTFTCHRGRPESPRQGC